MNRLSLDGVRRASKERVDKERNRRKEEGRDARREACQGTVLHCIHL